MGWFGPASVHRASMNGNRRFLPKENITRSLHPFLSERNGCLHAGHRGIAYENPIHFRTPPFFPVGAGAHQRGQGVYLSYLTRELRHALIPRCSFDLCCIVHGICMHFSNFVVVRLVLPFSLQFQHTPPGWIVFPLFPLGIARAISFPRSRNIPDLDASRFAFSPRRRASLAP